MRQERYIWARMALWHGAWLGMKLAALYFIALLCLSGYLGAFFYGPVLIIGLICVAASAMIGALTGVLMSLALSRVSAGSTIEVNQVSAVLISSAVAIAVNAAGLL